MTAVVLSLGSNCDGRNNILMAECMLEGIFSAIVFSDMIVTEAVGMPQGTPQYTNVVGVGQTALSLDEITAETKRIERIMGRSKSAGLHDIVQIDIDILQYGTVRYRRQDWLREYNIRLMREMDIPVCTKYQ